MATDPEKFNAMLQKIETTANSWVKLGASGITTADLLRLEQSMLKRGEPLEVQLHENQIDDEGAAVCARLIKNGLLKGLWIYKNPISETGIARLAEAIGSNSNLVSLYLSPHNFDGWAVESLSDSIVGLNHKNLTIVTGGGDVIAEHCSNNQETAKKLAIKLQDFRSFTPDELFEAWERLPAIRHSSESSPIRVTQFISYVEALPQLDLSQPVTPADLHQPLDESGKTPLDNPFHWQNFDRIISALNENGQRIGGKELLADGKPTPLFEQIIQRGKAPHLFTEDNWRGAEASELKAVLRALPTDVKSRLTNPHALLAAVEKHATPKSVSR